jgi:hypothetical protein
MNSMTSLESRIIAGLEGLDILHAKNPMAGSREDTDDIPPWIDMRLIKRPKKPAEFSSLEEALLEFKDIEQQDLEAERDGVFARGKIIGQIAVLEAEKARRKSAKYPIEDFDEHVEKVNGFRPEHTPDEEREALLEEINNTLEMLKPGLRYNQDHAEELRQVLVIPDRREVKRMLQRTAQWGRAALSYLPITGELVDPEIKAFKKAEWTGYYICPEYNNPHMYFNTGSQVTYTLGRTADLPAHEYTHAAEGAIKQYEIEKGSISPIGGLITYGDMQITQLEANAQLGSRMALTNAIESFPRGRKFSLEEVQLLFRLYKLTGRYSDMALHDAIYRANTTHQPEAAFEEFKQRAPMETEEKIANTIDVGTKDYRLMAYLLSYYQVLKRIVDPVFAAGAEPQKQFMTESISELLTPQQLEEKAHSLG